MSRRIATMAVVSLLATTAGPLASAGGLSYTFIEVGYFGVEIDAADTELDGNGPYTAGSVSVHDNVFLFGSYRTAEADVDIDSADSPGLETAQVDVTLADGDDVDVENADIGIGVRFELLADLDVIGRVSYVYEGVDDASENGYGIGVGARWRPTDLVDVAGDIDWLQFNDTSDSNPFIATLEARLWLLDNVAMTAAVSTDDSTETTIYSIGVRLNLADR